jgi:hypothetical protein
VKENGVEIRQLEGVSSPYAEGGYIRMTVDFGNYTITADL